MAITYASNVFSVTDANDESTLKAVVDANPTIAWYEGGACTFRSASLNFASGSSLTIRDGTNLVFGGAAGYKINGVDSILPILDFKNGGGIVYNGNVQHSFFRMDLRGNNITYRMNANTTNGRGDFFVGAGGYGVMHGSMKDLTLVMGNGASNWTYFIHLELLAGKINGLRIINDLRTSLGGGKIYLQFGDGTYQSVTLPAITSGYGISAALAVYLARSGGNSRLVQPSIPGSTLTIGGSDNGTAELVNEVWPDMAAGTVGAIAAGTINTNNTAVSRKITWTPGTYFTGGWNVDLRDSKATPTVYKNGLMTAASDIEMTWALYNRNPSSQTLYSPFKLVARKRGYLEQVKSFSPVQPVIEAFVPVVDAYYTSDQSALAGISASASTLTITTTGAFTGTVDQINDWFDWWLEQAAQLASVPATPKANSGSTMTITGWTLANAGTINAGTKLKAMTFATVTNTGTINTTFTDSTGTRVALTNRNGVAMTSYVLVNSTAVGGATVGGTFIPGFVPLVMSRTLTVLPADTIRMVVNAYGYKPQVINCTGAELDKFTVTLELEAGVDVTSVSTITRDAVAETLGFIQASPTQIDITVNQTLAAYFPKDCVAGVAYAFVNKGYLAFAAMAQVNNANIYSLSSGQMVTYFPGFKLRMNDTAVGGAAIVPTATGYSIPLVAYYYDQATSTAYPVTILNASSAKIETAPWTQATATLSEQDKTSIAAKVDASTVLAKEATSAAIKAKTDTLVNAPTLAQIEASTALAKEETVATRASQSSVTALGTPLQTSSYTAPDNTSITAIKAKTDTLVNAPTLAQIEASTVLAKETTVAAKASQASVNAIPTNPVLTTDARLDNLDALISSRLATSGYTAPDNTSITAIKSKTDTLVADIEASTILAKETTAQKAANKAALAAALSA